MSSVFAYAGDHPCKDIMVNSLLKLKAENFELSGMLIKSDGKAQTVKLNSNAYSLKKSADELESSGCTGIGEVKCVDRCKPSGITAPPADNEYFCVALDGNVSNFEQIKSQIANPFPIATDEDLILALLTGLGERNFLESAFAVSEIVEGGPSFAFIPANEDAVYAYAGKRMLYIGFCNGGFCLSSELSALFGIARKYFVLKNGELLKMTSDKAAAYDKKFRKIKKNCIPVYSKFINPQSRVAINNINSVPFYVNNTVKALVKEGEIDFSFLKLSERSISKISRIVIAGSAESYRASALAAIYIESMCDIPAAAAESGELCNAGTVFDKNTLLIAVSPNGEDVNTLFCVERAKSFQSHVLCVCAGNESSLCSKCQKRISALTNSAQPFCEYISCAAALSLFALWLGCKTGVISEMYFNVASKFAELLPGKISEAMKKSPPVFKCANILSKSSNVFVSGLGADRAAALEAVCEIREKLNICSSPLSCSEICKMKKEQFSSSCTIIFATDKDYVQNALKSARRLKAFSSDVIIFTTANIESETPGFDCVVPVTDSLPVFDVFSVLCAFESTVETAREIKSDTLRSQNNLQANC